MKVRQWAFRFYPRTGTAAGCREQGGKHQSEKQGQAKGEQALGRRVKPEATEVRVRDATTFVTSVTGDPHLDKSYAVNLNHAHEELRDLVERITIELELINVTKELDA